MRRRYETLIASLIALMLFSTCGAVELAVLSPKTWSSFATEGKEADCIYGDYVLRNDQITLVIARPEPGRHANMTVRDTGGMIIDLTRRDQPNDQLSALYVGDLAIDNV